MDGYAVTSHYEILKKLEAVKWIATCWLGIKKKQMLSLEDLDTESLNANDKYNDLILQKGCRL